MRVSKITLAYSMSVNQLKPHISNDKTGKKYYYSAQPHFLKRNIKRNQAARNFCIKFNNGK